MSRVMFQTGGHDTRHSLVESVPLHRRPSHRKRNARRRNVQEQKGQGAAHLEMQREAQESGNLGYRGLAGGYNEEEGADRALFTLFFHGAEKCCSSS